MSISAMSIPRVPVTIEMELPRAVLEGLADQVRASGQCLIVVAPDGQLLFSDSGAPAFFTRYVIPALTHAELAGSSLREQVLLNAAVQGAQIWDLVPGAVMSVCPFTHRRKLAAMFILAGRSAEFSVDAHVLELCQSLSLDPSSLTTDARDLPGYQPGQMSLGVSYVIAMARDRMRLSVMEGELTNLSSQLANTYEELTLLDQISGGMRVNRRASDFFRQACLDVIDVVGLRAMGVALWGGGHRQEPALYGSLQIAPAQLCRIATQLMDTLRGHKSALIINDLAGDKSLQWVSEYAGNMMAVPLLRQEQILGCLFAIDKTAGDFDSVDSKLLTSIANESAIYLENAMLFADVHGLMMGLLHSLTSAVDAKDAYTCGHSERVALLSRFMARQVGLPEQAVDRIYMAGLLHDVGKIGVPESVLQKAGRLTSDEYDQIKKHPRIGARILHDVKQLEDIVPGVLHHHERYDGRGYPAGLSGQSIPLMGRIICLADSFDAMTSNRTYRKALPLEVAMMEIRRCSGTQFDPALTEAFLQLSSEQFRSLMRDHRNQSKKLLDLQESLRAA